jgi:curved DNA-binding protein CbpA
MNPYEVLGLERNCTDGEIRRAARTYAARYHPDRGGDPQKMADINRARDLLLDPEARTKYDRTGDSTSPIRETAREKAIGAIMASFIAELAHDDSRDIVDVMRIGLKRASLQCDKNRTALLMHIKKVHRVRKRLKGGDLFDRALDEQIEGAKAKLEALREQDEAWAAAVELLEGYSMVPAWQYDFSDDGIDEESTPMIESDVEIEEDDGG